MIKSLLIANRGEIACRIMRTAKRMGIRTIAVYTEADRTWPHWQMADKAVLIGEGPAPTSYLDIGKLLAAARESGADAVHPGYGFLAENAAFATACGEAGLIFVGPPPEAIAAMGSKVRAKRIMEAAGVPVVPGYHGPDQSQARLTSEAQALGAPLMIKAAAGGGGRGLYSVVDENNIESAVKLAQREAKDIFGDGDLAIEKLVVCPRHIEFQILADAFGNVRHLNERDCSSQRHHQKLIEESPADRFDENLREYFGKMATQAAQAVHYEGVGTIEFVAESRTKLTAESIYFIEMNTRLQVEHAVTEIVTGMDLVETQLKIAQSEPLDLKSIDDLKKYGWGMEARIYAEDPNASFAPSTGTIVMAQVEPRRDVRVDSGVVTGSVVSPHYDGLLAKVIAHGRDRAEAIGLLSEALKRARIAGVKTNLPLLRAILAHAEFKQGAVDTGFIDRNLKALLGDGPDIGLAASAIAQKLEGDAKNTAGKAPGAWRRTDGFQTGGVPRRVGLEVMIDGRRQEAQAEWRDGAVVVTHLGREAVAPAPAAEIVWSGQTAYVFGDDGEMLDIGFVEPGAATTAGSSGEGSVIVPMSGRIIAVKVKPGDEVESGETLFLLEAMKMELPVTAPVAGAVNHVAIAAGDQAEAGTIAVEIAPTGNAMKDPDGLARKPGAAV